MPISFEQAKQRAIDYVAIAKQLETAFGSTYKSERNQLRTAFCASTLEMIDIQNWLAKQDEKLRAVILPLCVEWLKKIATPGSGLTRSNPLEANNRVFQDMAAAFYLKNKQQIESPLVAQADIIRSELREYVIAQLQSGKSAAVIISELNVTDKELKDRIEREWAMKASSAAFKTKPAATAGFFSFDIWNKRNAIVFGSIVVAAAAVTVIAMKRGSNRPA